MAAGLGLTTDEIRAVEDGSAQAHSARSMRS
jgi:hypothetical protein